MKALVLILFAIALLTFLNGKGCQLGRLPGDMQFHIGQRAKVFVPLGTCLLFSLLISLLLSLLGRR